MRELKLVALLALAAWFGRIWWEMPNIHGKLAATLPIILLVGYAISSYQDHNQLQKLRRKQNNEQIYETRNRRS